MWILWTMRYVVVMALVEETAEEPWVPADTFASRLALIRTRLGGWNVKRTADFCGIDDQSWRNWEASKGHPRDYEATCIKIARAVGCDLTWLKAGGPLVSIRWFAPSALAGDMTGQLALLEGDDPVDFFSRPLLASA